MKIFLGSFLLAASFLTSGENYKAQELFQAAAKGIFTDSFLEQRIMRTSDDNPTKAYINYYLKVGYIDLLLVIPLIACFQVIQLFELHKARDCAINMANTALSIVEPDDPLSVRLFI